MNEIDRLIAMLEPSASENTVLFVRNEIRNLIRGAWSNDYVPQQKLDDEVNVENTRQVPDEDSRSEQQKHDVYEVKDWNPNDPANW
tara:strand:- start:3134 stop:3391 length:258 start_codon:yes stop_codon:yes gene_type:complete